MKTWRHKAEEIIASYCLESYQQSNYTKNGKKRFHHVPYSVPEIAQALIKALDKNDEHEAKRLFEVERLGLWSMI